MGCQLKFMEWKRKMYNIFIRYTTFRANSMKRQFVSSFIFWIKMKRLACCKAWHPMKNKQLVCNWSGNLAYGQCNVYNWYQVRLERKYTVVFANVAEEYSSKTTHLMFFSCQMSGISYIHSSNFSFLPLLLEY